MAMIFDSEYIYIYISPMILSPMILIPMILIPMILATTCIYSLTEFLQTHSVLANDSKSPLTLTAKN